MEGEVMLVLTCRPGEQVQIGPDVYVTFLGRGHGSKEVKIGFDAPSNVQIKRRGRAPGWPNRIEHAANESPPQLTRDQSMYVEICLAMAAVYGAPLPKRLLRIGDEQEGWGVKLNPTDAPIDDIQPFAAFVNWNGWPAGVVNPHGGWIAAGDAANQETLRTWLQGIIDAGRLLEGAEHVEQVNTGTAAIGGQATTDAGDTCGRLESVA